jgi:hypothetical protein
VNRADLVEYLSSFAAIALDMVDAVAAQARVEGREDGVRAERERHGVSAEDALVPIRSHLESGDHDLVLEAVRSVLVRSAASAATTETLEAEVDALRRRVTQAERRAGLLQDVLRWTLGEGGEFRPREAGEDPFWWRKELRRRLAAL